ncbi:signal peptidase I [Agrococcus versicolor]|uniref:Signal peptidase I n=1 Tax=Agrococcus versicolor TaxID=501482 RepID=A0ABP5MHY1_9MICO
MATKADGRGSRTIILFLRDLAVIFLAALIISFLVKTFLVRPFYIPSPSMSDTLEVDDRVIVSLLTPQLVQLERGDVVVFEDPDAWLPDPQVDQPEGIAGAADWFLTFVGLAPDDSHGYLIKRVIGLPGDHVVCCNDFGQITINDVPIDETDYVTLDQEGLPASGTDFDVVVPEGQLWVLGDNRYHSADSRAHMDEPTGGFVPVSDVVGRAIVVSWPVARWQWIDDHDEVYSGVGSGGR